MVCTDCTGVAMVCMASRDVAATRAAMVVFIFRAVSWMMLNILGNYLLVASTCLL